MRVRQQSRLPLRRRWSHHHPLHRFVVRVANRTLRLVPLGPKYAVTRRPRATRFPYVVAGDGSTVIQVGAPLDTLHAGRQRALHFALRVQPTGRTIALEPDGTSVDALRRAGADLDLRNLEVVPRGAWSTTDTLRFYIDPVHPARSFTPSGTGDVYSEEQLQAFDAVDVPVSSIDDLIAELDVDRVDLVSITTNGSERMIVAGMASLIERDQPKIALAATDESLPAFMTEYGYEIESYDDRGFTFRRREGERVG